MLADFLFRTSLNTKENVIYVSVYIEFSDQSIKDENGISMNSGKNGWIFNLNYRL